MESSVNKFPIPGKYLNELVARPPANPGYPHLFAIRELSQLEFNQRVLCQAQNPALIV